MSAIQKQYAGFWRRQPKISGTDGWKQLPGVFPAGGDEPSNDINVAASALCKRAQIKPSDNVDESNRIEVKLYEVDGAATVLLDVSMTTQFRKV